MTDKELIDKLDAINCRIQYKTDNGALLSAIIMGALCGLMIAVSVLSPNPVPKVIDAALAGAFFALMLTAAKEY
jgi:hypothetical protein